MYTVYVYMSMEPKEGTWCRPLELELEVIDLSDLGAGEDPPPEGHKHFYPPCSFRLIFVSKESVMVLLWQSFIFYITWFLFTEVI